jgi:hypothetical protein
MYYEEKIINGKLMFRNKPNGDWNECTGLKADIVNKMLIVSEETRRDIIAMFTATLEVKGRQ